LTDYKDYQLFQFNAVPGSVTQISLKNAGAVRTYGPELEIDAEPIPRLFYTFAGAWLSAEYTSFPNGGGVGIDYSGHRMEFAPKWSLSNALEYSAPIVKLNDTTAFARLHLSYRSSQFTTSSNQAPFIIASYALMDAQIGLTKNAWRVALFGNNLLNRAYDTSSTTDAFGTILGFRGVPRTYGIQVAFRTQ
jgi:iron complex outermembrane receptor protein